MVWLVSKWFSLTKVHTGNRLSPDFNRVFERRFDT